MAARTIELVLTGHDHDLFINYDGRNAMVESGYDAQYVTMRRRRDRREDRRTATAR